jgi:hypothetical protein
MKDKFTLNIIKAAEEINDEVSNVEEKAGEADGKKVEENSSKKRNTESNNESFSEDSEELKLPNMPKGYRVFYRIENIEKEGKPKVRKILKISYLDFKEVEFLIDSEHKPHEFSKTIHGYDHYRPHEFSKKIMDNYFNKIAEEAAEAIKNRNLKI